MRAVVHADEVAVGGEPDVALERVGAVGERLDVGGERVLRDVGARAAVGDDLGHAGHRGTRRRDVTRRHRDCGVNPEIGSAARRPQGSSAPGLNRPLRVERAP